MCFSCRGGGGEGEDILPWYPEFEAVLYRGEVGEYAEEHGGGDDYYDEPEVELGFGPVVFPPPLDGYDLCGGHSEGGGGGEGPESRGQGPGAYVVVLLTERSGGASSWDVKRM